MKQNEKKDKDTKPAVKKQGKNTKKSQSDKSLSTFISKNKPAVIGVSTAFVAVILIISLILGLSTCGKSRALKKFEEDTSTDSEIYHVAMDVKDFGVIILKLDAKAAPITVANFIKLVREDFYDGLTFHRIIENFMIQGGDPEGNGRGGSDKKIFGEFSANGYSNPIKHERGVISMARSTAYNSASSQFFICNSNSASVSNLDGNYAAFGHVIEGMDVVDAITSHGVQYAIGGVIVSKRNQPTITEMKVIVYNEVE